MIKQIVVGSFVVVALLWQGSMTLAQEEAGGGPVLKEILGHLQELKDRRAALGAKQGGESEEGKRLDDRIAALGAAITSLKQAPSAKPRQTLMTLNFQETPLKEVLDFLAEKGGLNFVHAQGAIETEDRVTGKMRDVSAVHAAEMVLSSLGYRFHRGLENSVTIQYKDHLMFMKRERSILESEVKILQLLSRKQFLESEIEKGFRVGERVERKLELIGVLARKGEERIMIRTEERGEVECHLAQEKTESGMRVHPEIAALLKPIQVGDRVRFRCLQGERGWILQWLKKAE